MVTFNGIVGFTYHLGKSGRYALALGYRYMDMDIEEVEDGVRLKTDLTMSGAYAGFAIQW